MVTLCFDNAQITNYPPKRQMVTICFDVAKSSLFCSNVR